MLKQLGIPSMPTRKGVEARILVAGLSLIVIQNLWRFYVDEIREIEQQWRYHVAEEFAGQGALPMVTEMPMSVEQYFGSYGLKILIPHDLILVAYSAAVILSVASIIVLARALMAVEEKTPDKASRFIETGMRYFGWVMTLIVFFIVVHLMEESLFPFGTIFQENMWVMIGIAGLITIVVRALLGRAIAETQTTQRQPISKT